MDEEQRRLAEELLFTGGKKVSFAKLLYYGLLDAGRVFPYPSVSSEEQKRTDEYLEKLNHFADEHIDPASIDRQADIPDSVIKGLAQMGFFGVTIPSQYGGLNLSQYAYCRFTESLARRCASTTLLLNAHQSIGLKAVQLFGTEEQKNRWLPMLAKGEGIAAFALTEANAGSDASAVETQAIFIPERNVYRINGRKQWITNGSIASVLTVMARTSVQTPEGEKQKITAFLVTPDMPGFKVVTPALEKVGFRGTKTAILEFENMEVPASHVLGPIGAGLRICLTVLDYGRTTFGALCTGSSKFLIEKAIKHAKTRHQFKRPLASFALVKKKIACMSALAYAMDASTYLTAGLLDKGEDDIMLESAILKVFASDSLWSILYDAMQIFGGKSLFNDEPYERMMRDARLNMIGEGSNEVLRAFLGAVGMREVGLQLQELLSAFKDPFSQYQKIWRHMLGWGVRLKAPHLPVKSPHLLHEADLVGKSIRSFAFAIVKLLANYREDIVERQLELDRIATAFIAIYTSIAVLSKIDTDLSQAGANAEALGKDLDIARLYCHMATDITTSSLGSIIKNHDAEIEALSDKITGAVHS
jgi:alkylation response protein AidB-like acyl-CoA dehydrogenase